ncbi:MAG: hypothetical protein JO168_11200 [Solirubrobacterales bacterium]|nr:hypothetical protein [Solirubrobacterales bacterium]MBV9716961.1 hypothetical protein [Solirubrobacterales bacterium]
MNENRNPHSQSRNPHSVRRIVLPSGRSIEVVRFVDPETETERGLHMCPVCDSNLVQPIDWCEASDGRWELVLSCPNCHWSTEGTYTEAQVHNLEDQLDEGLADMLRDLKRLTQANMADHVERFTSALHADLILPEDF